MNDIIVNILGEEYKIFTELPEESAEESTEGIDLNRKEMYINVEEVYNLRKTIIDIVTKIFIYESGFDVSEIESIQVAEWLSINLDRIYRVCEEIEIYLKNVKYSNLSEIEIIGKMLSENGYTIKKITETKIIYNTNTNNDKQEDCMIELREDGLIIANKGKEYNFSVFLDFMMDSITSKIKEVNQEFNSYLKVIEKDIDTKEE